MTEPRPTYDAGGSELERAFLTHWRALAPDAPMPVREYRFAAIHAGGPGKGLRKRLEAMGLRDWRFDFAWPEPQHKVAVEIDGGQWKPHGGRHNTDDDRRKGNAATLLGWRVLHVSGDMLRDDPVGIVGMIRHALDWRRR